ncbi:MAG: RNA 2',3'-cyclic phosphodiesterase [bacterium]|nr:RNA 2',3'-cyclic phosphodiesterase [Candidatus Kapabacteria bacterium]
MQPDQTILHRCFYALRFEQPSIAYLSAIIDDLRAFDADVAWVRDESLHITLRFLGELTDEQLESALAVPGEPVVGAFTLRAVGLGAFPGLRNAKVMWAGIAAASEEDRRRFLELQSLAESWAQAIGLAPEKRRFRPHVTLGRVRRPGEHLREVIDQITTRECSSPLSTIREVLLMRSGPSAYEVLQSWSLETNEDSVIRQ